MEEKNNKIIINEKEYEIISYLTLDIGNFIVYTDGKELENGRIALYVNMVSKDNDDIILDEIDNDEMMKVISILKERLANNE